MTPPESHLQLDAQGRVCTYAGPDAVALARCRVLSAALRMWAKHRMIPARGWTITKGLAMASGITHKHYPRTTAGAESAIADLHQWAAAMAAALPVIQEESR